MAMWRGWSAALPSRPTWNEWQDLQRRRTFAARVEASPPDVSKSDRVAELEQFSRRLAVENAALRIALQHWQDQPVAVGAGA
ncbi:MAG TPA: hypothetical protein VH591_06595 [Ktedonobacterales bacterium]|jgi:hypothetical protein